MPAPSHRYPVTPSLAKSLAISGAVSIGGAAPSRRVITWLTVGVLVLHLVLLLGLTDSIDWRLKTDEAIRVAPLQTRWITPIQTPSAPPAKPVTEKPRTRLAVEAQKPPVSVSAPEPAPDPTPAREPEPTEAVSTDRFGEIPLEVATVAASEEADTTPPTSPPNFLAAEAPDSAVVTEQAVSPVLIAPSDDASKLTQNTQATPAAAPEVSVGDANRIATTPLPDLNPTSNAQALPPVPLGALPPPVLLSYKMTGQEKGLIYHANGELRWQHNESAYALSLSVKAFLVGSRHWRSQGEITSAGLAPTRFSDSWRNERAAHFDRVNNKVVFSNNAPVTSLEPGAQDQISLYVQLAAAMAGEPERFQPGTRLQIQTATIRDALPWLLTLAPPETLQLDGETLQTVKWVCQPRNRFDATVEFWVSAQHAWMPVRIRITQRSGSYIDLVLRGQEPLPPLPKLAPA